MSRSARRSTSLWSPHGRWNFTTGVRLPMLFSSISTSAGGLEPTVMMHAPPVVGAGAALAAGANVALVTGAGAAFASATGLGATGLAAARGDGRGDDATIRVVVFGLARRTQAAARSSGAG